MTKLTNIGDYEILEELGAGGMGVVYKAKSPLGIVALKIVSSEMAQNKDFIQRFLREMHLVQTLENENIVQCLDCGVDLRKDIYFLALEFVDGENLETYLRREGQLGLLDALYVVYKVSLGLQHAWEKNIVHRDIKPDNILVDINGNLKIADFGLAKCLGEGGMTQVGTMLGTPLYMAPEQALEGEEEVDTRADIYSLGITLFYFLAGEPPFLGKNAMEVINAHIKTPLPSLAKFCPAIPKPVIQLLEKMTAKKPSDRYNTPLEVAKIVAHIKDLPEVQNYHIPKFSVEETPISLSQTKFIPNDVFLLTQQLVQEKMISEKQVDQLLMEESFDTPRDLIQHLVNLKITTKQEILEATRDRREDPTRKYSTSSLQEKMKKIPKCTHCKRGLESDWIVCPYCSTVVTKSDPPSLKILIGERDDTALQELTRFFLEIYPDAVILSATDGKTALQILKEEQPTVAFLHCFLPGQTGIEVCQELHKTPSNFYTPVFILTDAYVPLIKMKAYQAGARDFVGKPLNKEELQVKLEQVLNGSFSDTARMTSINPELSKSKVMIGHLEIISLAELIQSFHRSKETGVLTITSKEREGKIYFKKGTIINSTIEKDANLDENMMEEDAFFQIFQWRGGSFQFSSRPPQVEDVFTYNTMTLLMEGLRRLDEVEREEKDGINK